MSQTVKQILKQSSANISKLDLELLLAHVLKKSREFVISHPEMIISKLDNWKIGRLIKKRQSRIPIAYLVGHKEFYGFDFLVNKHTLVPRPDTEILVDATIEEITRYPLPVTRYTLIDVGTGSGCIPISIVKTLKHLNIKTFAIDISRRALKVARKNATKHGTQINFLHGNLLEPLASKVQSPKSKTIITANLPYLTEEQFKNEPSIQHEPKSALVAKNNGLALYEELLKQINSLSTSYKLQATSFLEIDPSQARAITKLIKKYLPNAKIQIKKDLSGLDRVVSLKIDKTL